MVKVRKENRVLYVFEDEKEVYKAKGYDVIDSVTGEVLEHATGGRTFTTEEYNSILVELAQVKKELDETKAALESATKGKGGKNGKASDPKGADAETPEAE